MGIRFGSALELRQIATPAANPAAGIQLLYVKSDGKVYTKDSTGAEVQVAGSASGVSSVNTRTGAVVLDKTDVGLANVPNVDMRNLSNATSGTVPNAQLPPRLQTQEAATVVMDLNTATDSGWYYAHASATNSPAGAYAHLEVRQMDAGSIIQEWRQIASDVRYVRHWNSTAWTAWQRMRATESEQDARYLGDNGLPGRLGTACLTISNWNTDAEANGWYMADTAANAPASGWFIGQTIAHRSNTPPDWLMQTLYPFVTSGMGTGSDSGIWRRVRQNDVWQSWYRLREAEPELDARYVTQGTTQTISGAKTFSGNMQGFVVPDTGTNGWNGPLMVQAAANPRMIFHYPNVVARTVYVNSAGDFKFVSDDGSAYVPIRAGAVYDYDQRVWSASNRTEPDARYPQIVEYTTTVPARPAGAGKVIWQGQVDPAANALAGDSWWPTA